MIIGLSAVGGVVVLIAVLGVIGSLVSGNGSGGAVDSATPARTLTLPPSVAGYTQATGNVADRAVAATRAGLDQESPQWTDVFKHAKVALYAADSDPSARLVFLGFSAADSAQSASVMHMYTPSTPSVLVDHFFMGAGVTNTTDFPAGPPGGVMRCGQTTRDSAPVTLCAWGDSSVFVTLTQTNISEARLASTALAFRGAAEH